MLCSIRLCRQVVPCQPLSSQAAPWSPESACGLRSRSAEGIFVRSRWGTFALRCVNDNMNPTPNPTYSFKRRRPHSSSTDSSNLAEVVTSCDFTDRQDRNLSIEASIQQKRQHVYPSGIARTDLGAPNPPRSTPQCGIGLSGNGVLSPHITPAQVQEWPGGGRQQQQQPRRVAGRQLSPTGEAVVKLFCISILFTHTAGSEVWSAVPCSLCITRTVS